MADRYDNRRGTPSRSYERRTVRQDQHTRPPRTPERSRTQQNPRQAPQGSRRPAQTRAGSAARKNYSPSYYNNTANRAYDPRRSAADALRREQYETRRREYERERILYERERRAAYEARRRLEEQLKKERKMRRKRQRKIFFGRAAVCLVIFTVMLILSGILISYSFLRSPDKESSKITYTCGGAQVRSSSVDEALRGGKLYVCFNDISDYLDLRVSGDADSMRFIKANDDTSVGSEGDGNEEYVRFFADSRTVEINSISETLPADTFFYGESVWVCADFITEYVNGLTLTRDGDTVEISRIVDTDASDEKNTVYTEVTFSLKPADPIILPETEESSDALSQVTFSTDLSEYEEYMNPKNAEEYLILVNASNPLESDYIPEDLTPVSATRNDGCETQQLRLAAAKALEALFIEMNAAGYTDVSVTSGYRSYDYQSTLFSTYTQNEMAADPSLSLEEAEAMVSTYSSRPGTSEHQSGLCVDMHNLSGASVEFKDEDAYRWLTENAWKFGFILRYPDAKTDVTSISFEPWHWRFVGRKAAYEISNSSLCLEEYK